MTNWSDAVRRLGPVDTRALVGQLACRCGARNRPHASLANPIRVDDKGNAACDTCGAFGAVQAFLPPPYPTGTPRRLGEP